MRYFYLFFLILLLISCTEKTIEIKNSNIEKIGIEKVNIRTTDIDLDKETYAPSKKPEIDIINPKDEEVIEDGVILVRLNISNFKIVTPDSQPRKEQGHVQVWVDDMGYKGSKTEFVFENLSNGTHIIKAELMTSNDTVLPYSKTIRVIVNKT